VQGGRDIPYVVENDQGARPAAIAVADGIEDSLAHDGGEQLLNEEGQQDSADRGQVEVVDQEERLQLEGFSVAHQAPAAEDDDVVDHDEDAGLPQRRHGRGACSEPEVIGGIAHDQLEGLVEDGP